MAAPPAQQLPRQGMVDGIVDLASGACLVEELLLPVHERGVQMMPVPRTAHRLRHRPADLGLEPAETMGDQRVVLPAAAGEVDLLDGVDEGIHGANDTPPGLLTTTVGEPGAPAPKVVGRGPGDRRPSHMPGTTCCGIDHVRHLSSGMDCSGGDGGDNGPPRGEVIASGCP